MSIYYFDMNVIVSLMKRDSDHLSKLVDELKNSGCKIVYSPAHIEEVANIIYEKKTSQEIRDSIKNHLDFIYSLTGGFECLPSYRDIVIEKEHPIECYKRVVDLFEDSLTAEKIEEMRQSFRSDSAFEKVFGRSFTPNSTEMMYEQIRSRHGINIDRLREVDPEILFKQESVSNALKEKSMSEGNSYIINCRYADIKNSHRKIEMLVDYLLNFLEIIGYHPEKSGKHRSKMHDTTHAIYGTKADYYISKDDKHVKKVKAVYSFIEAETKALHLDEFLKL